jgi:pre-mRNA-processing factor 6
MKSAVFERQQGHPDAALETVQQALVKYPKFAKLYMIQGQIYQSQKKYANARASFAAGLKQCPKEGNLWILASRLEELDGKSIKARALLERARLVNPGSDLLWVEAVGVEERSGGTVQAKAMLARGEGFLTDRPGAFFCSSVSVGLQECPSSGLLWSMSIWAEPRPTRKSRSVDALKKSRDDPLIICTVARLFWAERKIEKAREWFGRALAQNADLGDIWAWWLKFEAARDGGGFEYFFISYMETDCV